MQFDVPLKKLEDIAATLQNIAPEGQINNAHFVCSDPASDQTVVFYRANLSGQTLDSCELLLSTIEQWVTAGSAFVIVRGNSLSVESTCSLEISSFSALTTCNTNTKGNTNTATTVGAIVGIIAIVIVASAALLVIWFVKRKW